MMDQNRKSSAKSASTSTIEFVSYSRHLLAHSTNRSSEEHKLNLNLQSQSINDNSIPRQQQNNDHSMFQTMHSAISNRQQKNSYNSVGVDSIVLNANPTSEPRRSNRRKKSSNQCRRLCFCLVLFALLFLAFILAIFLPFKLIQRTSTTARLNTETQTTGTTVTTTTSTSTTSTSSTTTSSTSTTTTSTITTTILITSNVTTGASLSSWYGELSIYLRCSGTIKDALLQITVVKTSGLSSAGQYETYGGSVFTQSITSNSTYVTYQWKMNSGKILICTGSSVQFAAQISLSGLAHSKSNDTYHVETMDSYNNTNIIDGYF